LTGFTEHVSVNTQAFDEYHAHVDKFYFGGPLSASSMDGIVNESLEDLGVLVGVLVASHEEHWDDPNFVAVD
jgi:hypothetical protein